MAKKNKLGYTESDYWTVVQRELAGNLDIASSAITKLAKVCWHANYNLLETADLATEFA